MAKAKTQFVDENYYERKAQAILNVVGNLRLIGETGVGKSTFVHYMTDKHDWELYEYPLSTDTSRWDLLAQDILTATKEGTETAERVGPIVDWLLVPSPRDKKKKQVLFLDEFNYAQPNVLTLMNMLTDFRKQVYVNELKGSKLLAQHGLDPKNPMLQRTPDHYCIIGMNPAEKSGYTGTFTMNIAQLRRFESLELKYIGQQTEIQLLKDRAKVQHNEAKHLVTMANQTRALYRVGILSTPITTGNLENYARLLVEEKLSEDDVSQIMAAMYTEAERDTILALWSGKTSAEQIIKSQEILG